LPSSTCRVCLAFNLLAPEKHKRRLAAGAGSSHCLRAMAFLRQKKRGVDGSRRHVGGRLAVGRRGPAIPEKKLMECAGLCVQTPSFGLVGCGIELPTGGAASDGGACGGRGGGTPATSSAVASWLSQYEGSRAKKNAFPRPRCALQNPSSEQFVGGPLKRLAFMHATAWQ